MDKIVELQRHLCGRALLKAEIPFAVPFLQMGVEKGIILQLKAIANGRCLRCGNHDHAFFGVNFCSECKGSCIYCRYCLKLGKISSCAHLYIWGGEHPTWEKTNLAKIPTLSTNQEQASNGVINAISEKNDYFIWAVTGSGKTEMIFKGCELALKLGMRVAFSSPRVDVVIEIGARLKLVFPHAEIVMLYGGSEEKYHYAQLVILTTHQLFRFKGAFDVIIVDEVDAFPYSFDKRLQQAVRESLKSNGIKIYLTATPDKKMQADFFTGKIKGTWIPARFHGFPLPVPRCLWIGNWQKKINSGELPAKLEQWLKQRIRPFLLFFPNIKHMYNCLPLIKVVIPNVDAVHAADPERKRKVEMLKNGEIIGLLTTTILERGITISGLEVAVIGADMLIFTEEALVQIAGRVGRNASFPSGEIIFFHNGQTLAMGRAIKQISNNNKQATLQGMLKTNE